MDRNVRAKFDNQVNVNELSADWTHLPDDTIIRLFSCLNNRDRATLSSTCKPWWILSKSPFLWESLDLRLYNCDAQAAKSLASRCSNNLRKLRIRGHEAAASVINLKANNLREISIDNCRGITDLTLTTIVARHEALECLQLGPDFCENISSAGIKVTALCCSNLKKLWLSGVDNVNGEAIHALADNCQNLIDVGFIDCGKVDAAALGIVTTLGFLSIAGTTNINWNLALLHWNNLLNLVCLDVSRTDIEPSAVSELLLSCVSLKVLCALNCPSLEQNPTSINRRGKTLVAFFTDILQELATLFIGMPRGKENVFLDWRNLKDRKLEGVLDWLEWALCDSLSGALKYHPTGLDEFLLHQGTILLISFLQSPHEEVKERAATALVNFPLTNDEYEDFDVKGTETVIREGGIHFLVNLGRSWQEGLQLESVQAITNLSMNDKIVKVLLDEGVVEVLIKIVRSARKTVAAKALAALGNISACDDEHKTAIAKGGLRVVVDIIVNWSKSNGGEVLMEPAARALANFVLDEELCLEVALLGVVPVLVKLLRPGMAQGVQTEAARCLANMAMHDDSYGNHTTVGQETGALEALVQLLRSNHKSVRKQSAHALWNLSLVEGNQEAIAAVGGVQALVALASSCTSASYGLQKMVAGALWGLSVSEENSIAIGEEGGLRALTELGKSDVEEVDKNVAGALWNLASNSGNAMRIIQGGDGVSTLVYLCSSSLSNMARFMSGLALAYMSDTRLDELAIVGTSGESTSKSARLEIARKAASKGIKALLESYSDPQAFSSAASSSSPSSEALTRVKELAYIQEACCLKCSESHMRRFLTMLCHPCPILKSFGAFALLQFTIPGDEHALRHANLLKRAGASRVLRVTVALASTPEDAKAFARVVLKNLEHHNVDDSN